MKKILAALCGMVATVFASNCHAMIDSAQIALGGIRPNMTAREVVDIAGQPQSKSHSGHDWYYPGFKVELDDDAPNLVEEIQTKSNNVATPDGVFVGYSADILTQIYGAADKVKTKSNHTVYTYYSTDNSAKMKFKVVNGTIVEISCEDND